MRTQTSSWSSSVQYRNFLAHTQTRHTHTRIHRQLLSKYTTTFSMRCWRHCWLCCCAAAVAASVTASATAAVASLPRPQSLLLLLLYCYLSLIQAHARRRRRRHDDETTSSTTRTANEAKRKIGAKEKINFHSVNFCRCSRMVVFVARRSRTLTLTLCCVVVSPLLPVACEKTDENNNNTNK